MTTQRTGRCDDCGRRRVITTTDLSGRDSTPWTWSADLCDTCRRDGIAASLALAS